MAPDYDQLVIQMIYAVSSVGYRRRGLWVVIALSQFPEKPGFDLDQVLNRPYSRAKEYN